MQVEIPPDEKQRLADLRTYDCVGLRPGACVDVVTDLATHIFRVPISAISFVDREVLWFRSKQGLACDTAPRVGGFCAHAILGHGLFVIQDATADPRFAASPLVCGPPFIRFYAGAPLRSPRGHNLGALCIMDQTPRGMSEIDAKILTALSRLAVDEFELQRQALQLSEDEDRLRSAEESVDQAFSRLERMQHDLIRHGVAVEPSDVSASLTHGPRLLR